MDTFLQQVVNGLTLGCVYAVVALGYTMVYGIIQLINFAHGEVVMIGCMVAFSVIVALAGTGMPPLAIVGIGTAIAVPVCMIVGFVIERAAYLPFALPGITVALALIVLSLSHLQAIYNSTTLLLIAYSILSLPLPLVAVRAALAQAPPLHEEVARSLGAQRRSARS